MILFLDGCSHYSTTELGQKWTALDTTAATWTIAAEGRTANCIKRVSTSAAAPGYLTFSPLWTQSGTWTQTTSGTFGAALKVDDLVAVEANISSGVFSVTGGLFAVWNGLWQMAVVGLNTNGTFSLYDIQNGTIRATSVRGINDDEWTYLEFQWLISTNPSTADGAFIIRSNGNQIMNYSGILYASKLGFATPTRAWNGITWLGTRSNDSPLLTMRSCDHYLCDRVASVDPSNPNDTFLGDITIDYIKPDGVGAQSDWTPSAGANWECVDEVPPNSDTDYVVSTAVGDRDTYTFEDITGDPKAIQICIYTRKEDASGASIAEITRQGGVDEDGPTHGLGSTAYDYELQPQDVNPATSLQWTEAEVNAGEWGPLKVA